MSEAVSNLLTSKGIAFTPSGRDFLIKCLNPDHEDTNPSLRVDKLSGIAHCFACNWKRNLFKHFGVFTDNTPIKIAKLKEKLKELRDANIDLELPEGAVPFNRNFRGISAQTFRHFEAFTTNRVDSLADRVVFPIRNVTGKIQVFQGRYINSDAHPKYKAYPGGISLPLFPSKLEEGTHSLVLVEGIFDLLNLWDKGVRNAVCIFGVTSITEANAADRMLVYKAQGVTKVFIAFDPDNAGQTAAKGLRPILEKVGFVVENIELPEDSDPGSLSAEHVASIKEYVK